MASFDRTTVTIGQDSRFYCTNCYYIVGVLSGDNTRSADFSIVAVTNGSYTVLTDGVPRMDTVAQRQFQYYRIVLATQTDLQINVNPFFGDPDIYVSWDPNNTVPTRTHCNARSESMYNDTVYIQVRSRWCWGFEFGSKGRG